MTHTGTNTPTGLLLPLPHLYLCPEAQSMASISLASPLNLGAASRGECLSFGRVLLRSIWRNSKNMEVCRLFRVYPDARDCDILSPVSTNIQFATS